MYPPEKGRHNFTNPILRPTTEGETAILARYATVRCVGTCWTTGSSGWPADNITDNGARTPVEFLQRLASLLRSTPECIQTPGNRSSAWPRTGNGRNPPSHAPQNRAGVERYSQPWKKTRARTCKAQQLRMLRCCAFSRIREFFSFRKKESFPYMRARNAQQLHRSWRWDVPASLPAAVSPCKPPARRRSTSKCSQTPGNRDRRLCVACGRLTGNTRQRGAYSAESSSPSPHNSSHNFLWIPRYVSSGIGRPPSHRHQLTELTPTARAAAACDSSKWLRKSRSAEP